MTSFALPVYNPPASAQSGGWQLVDRITRAYSATADASGTATVSSLQLDAGLFWSIEHMVCWASSGARSTFRLYENTVDPLQLMDGTDAGNFCVADWSTGLLLSPSSLLLMQWTGADVGAACRVRLQASVLRTGS